jgi:glyoxylase-like metal-dependent hydrolase (beta-lactamase superfamily II)
MLIMPRRDRVALLLCVASLSLAAAAAQQTPMPGKVPIPGLTKVHDNFFVLGGGDPRQASEFSGGNTGVFVAERGVVLVDTKFPGWGRVILDKVKTVTDKPVIAVINTHTHFDHAGSNAEFPATVDFVAHENTKQYMMHSPCPPVTTCLTGENAKFLPKKTFKDKLTLYSGRDQIDLYHFGPGHTSGDLFVVFPALRTIQTGDMFQVKWLPFIDDRNGGSSLRFGETLRKVVAGVKNVDTVITGHGVVMTWNDLRDHAEILSDFADVGRAGKKAGRTPGELAKSYKLPAKYAASGYDIAVDRAQANFEILYKELP